MEVILTDTNIQSQLPKIDDVRKQENITCKFVLKSSYSHPTPNRTPEFY